MKMVFLIVYVVILIFMIQTLTPDSYVQSVEVSNEQVRGGIDGTCTIVSQTTYLLFLGQVVSTTTYQEVCSV